MRFVTVDEFLDYDSGTLEWLVHGMIPSPGKIMLVGPEKVGKSMFAVELANHVAGGKDFLGHKTEEAKVLYFQVDTPRPVWKDMLRKIRESGVVFSPNLVFEHPEDTMRPLNVLSPDTRTYLKQVIKEAKPSLVVADVLREMHTAKENDSTEMSEVGRALDDVFKDVALLIVHHSKKNLFHVDGTPITDPVKAARGSSYMAGKVDGLWLLADGHLYTVSRFDERVTYSLIRQENGLWDSPSAKKHEAETAAALVLCQRFPEWTHNRIASVAKAELGWSRNKFYRLVAGRPCVHNVAK